MNSVKYNDQILENKGFNFFKQLMFNLGVLICIVLSGLLVLIYGFKFGVYEVLSDSQAPVFVKGDLVITKPQKDYEIGDIIKFDLAEIFTTVMETMFHLLILQKKLSIHIQHGKKNLHFFKD